MRGRPLGLVCIPAASFRCLRRNLSIHFLTWMRSNPKCSAISLCVFPSSCMDTISASSVCIFVYFASPYYNPLCSLIFLHRGPFVYCPFLLDRIIIPSRITAKHPRKSDWHTYKERHLVENLFLKLKNNRRFATRYEKKALYFRAVVCLACILVWLL